MKKSISFLLAIIMLLSAFPLTGFDNILPLPKANAAQETKAEKIYFGDMNENGKHEAADARRILRYSVALDVFSDRQQEIADCNADGKITAADARIELRASVGLEKTEIFESNVLTNAEFLTLLMVSAGYGACETEPHFKNVPATHKNFEGVQAAVDWNVLDKKNAFEPDKDATIGYALELAAKIKDVPSGAKLLSGTVDKKAALTKETAAKITEKVKEYRLKDKNEKEFESVEIKDTVTTYNKNDAKAVDEDTFKITNDVPKAGDIFRAQTPDGEVARKVVSAKKNADGSYTVETVKPEMDEVFDDFSFVKSLTLDPDEIDFVPAENVFVVNDPTQPQLHMADKKKNVIINETFAINSSNDPNLTPELCVTSTSDYIKALNDKYVCQVPNGKELLEKYNELVKGPGENNKTVKTEKVIKYKTGWGVVVSIELSDFDIDFDFADFWTKGDYEITLSANLDISGEFKGKFNSYVKLGHFPVKLGIADIIMDLDIDVYLYFDANGDIKLVGKGKIEQSYGNYGGKPAYLNNNSLDASLTANIEAEGGLRIEPKLAALGFEIVSMKLKIGVYGKANAKVTPVVEYKAKEYYYAGDFFNAPSELKQKFSVCVNLSCSFPIVTVTVSAGEDVQKQVEKFKKKNPDMIKIPMTYTFNICTLEEKTLLKPKTLHTHLENSDNGIKAVDECTKTDYQTIAHKLSGYVVDKNTGKILAGATIQLTDTKGNVYSETVTDNTGNFELKFVPFGTYKIKIINNKVECVIDKSFVVDKNETNVGKLEFSFDIVSVYAEQLQKNGKTITYNKTKYQFLGAAVCHMLKDTEFPQLAVAYYSKIDNWEASDCFVIQMYNYQDNGVVLVNQSLLNHYIGAVNIWKNPITGLYDFSSLSRYSEATTMYVHEINTQGKAFNTYRVGFVNVFSGFHLENNNTTKYKNYIYSLDSYRNNIAYNISIPDFRNPNEMYSSKNTAPDDITIAVFDAKGEYKIQYFAF